MTLPFFFLAYLVAAPAAPLGRRVRHCLAEATVVVVVSLAWMVVVTGGPAAHRPYVDGTSDNSVFTQVFVYNGFRGWAGLS